MKPPCRGCEHEFLEKAHDYLPLKPNYSEKLKKNCKPTYIKHVPGVNYPNPCSNCKRREAYDDYNSLSLDCGPTYYASSFEPTRILNAEA